MIRKIRYDHERSPVPFHWRVGECHRDPRVCMSYEHDNRCNGPSCPYRLDTSRLSPRRGKNGENMNGGGI